MKKFAILIALIFPSYLIACNNFIVTKGASSDGSTFLAYTNDAEYLYNLHKTPAMDHPQGSWVEFGHGGISINGKIRQVPHTYASLGFHMNEHQVAIGETILALILYFTCFSA